VPALEYGGVTGFFGKSGEPTFQPPGQGMEPENRAIEQRQPLHQWVAAEDVLTLVSQYGVKLLLGPRAPTLWQNYCGPEPSDRNRRGA
jgi:hypothetical protein